jgi:adenylate cyclase
MATTRRLAAILAADVAGYSRLMGVDEEGTHARLRAHFAELVHPKILEHRGRVVKNTGDGLLAEFPSVVDAVRCAAGVQEGMSDRNSSIPTDERIEFRVGVNLGDVIAEGDDIFGDGVNIAARLEGLAAPGGVCVSGTVLDHIGDRLPYGFADMGEQSVKNIARPVRVYALRSEAVRDRPKSAVLGNLPTSQPTAAPRLSIVVLPFANLSNDPEQQYFADGITEDLTTDLSRIAGMFVISSNTAFTYQGKRVDTTQIGRELCVRYVLEGSVRRSDKRVRVNAQLIDAESDVRLWAERFDGDTSDLFALQDESYEPDRHCARRRVGRRGGRSADAKPRCPGLRFPRTGHWAEACFARHLCGTDHAIRKRVDARPSLRRGKELAGKRTSEPPAQFWAERV